MKKIFDLYVYYWIWILVWLFFIIMMILTFGQGAKVVRVYIMNRVKEQLNDVMGTVQQSAADLEDDPAGKIIDTILDKEESLP